MAALTDAALGTGAKVGRYFNIVSFVPSLLFVLYLGGLLRAGAWRPGGLHPSDALTALNPLAVTEIFSITLLTLALGFALHPFQFAATQLLEGYWGPSKLARLFAAARTVRHQSRALDLESAATDASDAIPSRLVDGLSAADRAALSHLPDEEQERRLKVRRGTTPGLVVTPLIVLEEAVRRARAVYPLEVDRIRPTRLGNAMRRFEDAAGAGYGLDAISVAPHLSLVADPTHAAWQADARRQLDFSVRLCMLALLATPISAALLYDNGLWVFLTLGPFIVAYFAYRGAISSAQGYGSAVTTVLDLNRFRLYEALHLPMPPTTDDERIMNDLLLDLLSGDRTVDLSYSHPLEEASSSGSATERPDT